MFKIKDMGKFGLGKIRQTLFGGPSSTEKYGSLLDETQSTSCFTLDQANLLLTISKWTLAEMNLLSQKTTLNEKESSFKSLVTKVHECIENYMGVTAERLYDFQQNYTKALQDAKTWSQKPANAETEVQKVLILISLLEKGERLDIKPDESINPARAGSYSPPNSGR